MNLFFIPVIKLILKFIKFSITYIYIYQVGFRSVYNVYEGLDFLSKKFSRLGFIRSFDHKKGLNYYYLKFIPNYFYFSNISPITIYRTIYRRGKNISNNSTGLVGELIIIFRKKGKFSFFLTYNHVAYIFSF